MVYRRYHISFRVLITPESSPAAITTTTLKTDPGSKYHDIIDFYIIIDRIHYNEKDHMTEMNSWQELLQF